MLQQSTISEEAQEFDPNLKIEYEKDTHSEEEDSNGY